MTAKPPIWAPEGASLEHEFAAPNGVDIHYVVAGPEEGDLVVCLHGFPDFWYSWHDQIPALADAGYRVVAPDMRGANRSGKPADVWAYHLTELAADAAGLIDHLDRSSAHVVGHDFGGLAAWQLAATDPEAIDRLAILNAPHLTVFDRHLRSSLTQMLRSNYVAFFQLPWLPEYAIRRVDFAAIEALLREQVSPDALTDEDVRRYKTAASRDGAVTGMLNWYRAMGRWYIWRHVRHGGLPDRTIQVPTLLCWGEQDHALEAEMVEPHREIVDDVRIRRFPEAGHWVQFDASEGVNDALVEFLAR